MHLSRRLVIALVPGLLVLGAAGAAYAGTITQPTGNPFIVPGDAAGNPLQFTIVGSGFTPGGTPIQVEECDGVPPTSPGWNPLTDCDLATSPTPRIIQPDGTVTFPANDPNFGFPVFKGESPQSIFNCLSPHDPAPNNGLPSFRNCQIRLASDDTNPTSDQAFLNIQLPDAPTATTTTTTVATGPTKEQLGTCNGLNALASFKTAAGTGINNTNQQAKISVKSLNGGTCSPTANSPLGTAIDSLSFKASLSGQSVSCNRNLPPLANTLPASGKVGFTQATGTIKEQGYIRLAGNDPTVNYFADVVSVHGIMTKGPLAGADVDGTLSQDPTIKDKTIPPATFGAFTGVDINPVDMAQIGASCATGSSSGTLLFNDGSAGGTKGPIQVPTTIALTMVTDGTSVLDNAGMAPPPNIGEPGVPASGLSFSAF